MRMYDNIPKRSLGNARIVAVTKKTERYSLSKSSCIPVRSGCCALLFLVLPVSVC